MLQSTCYNIWQWKSCVLFICATLRRILCFVVCLSSHREVCVSDVVAHIHAHAHTHYAIMHLQVYQRVNLV